jgi:hypothetical protein
MLAEKNDIGRPTRQRRRPSVERNLVVDHAGRPARGMPVGRVNATQRAAGEYFKVRATTVVAQSARQRRPCMNVMELSLCLIVMLAIGVCACIRAPVLGHECSEIPKWQAELANVVRVQLLCTYSLCIITVHFGV